MDVVIVEDSDWTARDIQQMILETDSLQVSGRAAEEGEAINMILGRRPDLVILDIGLRGGGNGVAVLKAVRAAGCNCWVIVLTNSEERFYAGPCLSAGADEVICKMDFETLRDSLMAVEGRCHSV